MPARVKMTKHSLIREAERLGHGVKNDLEKSLKAELKRGTVPDERGAVHAPIRGGVGILMASPWGGWDCVTVERR